MVSTVSLIDRPCQLERRNAEAAAKAKRARRRANEVKTKTIQRMQLQMTTPLEIGLEQNDASLNMGQDDMFDLVDTQRGLRKKGGINKIALDDEMPSDDDEDGANQEVESSDEEIVDSEEERERRVSALEANLDEMYDAYQEKLKERDAKYRVQEARKKNGQVEEWSGLKDDKGDESGDDSSEDGGWEQMAAVREIGDLSSDESDDDEPTVGQKRKRPDPALKTHTDPQPPSRAAQVWFSQDIFKGMAEPAEDDEDDEVEEVEEVEMISNSNQQSDHEMVYQPNLLSQFISDDA